MGRKDTAGKVFFSDKERFAELMNVHLFCGNKTVLGEHLIRRDRDYPSLSGVYGEKKRDILIEDKSRNLYFGMELETESDYSMPERIMVYDACEYECQIREIYGNHRKKGDFKEYREKKSRIKETDLLHPVVTVVLYLGEGHWEGKRSLSQLFCIAKADAEQLKARLHVYDFLLQAMQSRRDRKRLKGLLESEDFRDLEPAAEQAIAAHLHVKKLFCRMNREGISMCQAFDELMKEERLNGKREGRREGKREGEKAGKKKERFSIVRKMHKKGMEEALIRELTGCTKKEFAAATGK